MTTIVDVEIQPSDRKFKKYVALLPDGRKVHFGDKRYQQFKDSTGLGLYSHLDHGNKKRRENYFSRHSAGIKDKKKAIDYEWKKSGEITAKLLSHQFLW
jgi:hypothetical protein